MFSGSYASANSLERIRFCAISLSIASANGVLDPCELLYTFASGAYIRRHSARLSKQTVEYLI